MNDYVLGQARYIGSFKELPESAEENDTVLVGNSLYLWRDTWHEIINYEENLLSKMIKVVREARDSKLKRELEKLIREENMKDNVGKPPSWIEGYVREVLLGGESILPYICEEEANENDLYDGTSDICPICGGRIKHPYTGHATSEQLDEDFNTCQWMEVTDESRSCLGYRPICTADWKKVKKD